MNREFYVHDVVHENNFNYLTVKSYQIATEKPQMLGGGGGMKCRI